MTPLILALNGQDLLIGVAVGLIYLAMLAHIARDNSARREWRGGRR